jgi:hypothetical protein
MAEIEFKQGAGLINANPLAAAILAQFALAAIRSP